MSTFDLENPNPNAGDALRDEAANLLSLKYGRPLREYRDAGKKSDLFFIRKDFGKDYRIYVEAKDYDRPLNRSDMVTIWADYSGIIEKNKPAALLVITQKGLTADAQAYALNEQSGLRHQTIWELENDTSGLTEYIRTLVDLFSENGLSSYYIAGKARRATYNGHHRETNSPPTSIFDEIKSWLGNGDNKPIAILGGYGAGKTSLATRVISTQAKAALENPLERRPVFIKLGVISRYSSLEGLLGGMFTYDFPTESFNVRNFLTLNEKGRLLIVLDGFDEMKHAMTWADFRSQIQTLNQLTKGNSKVLLLGRPSAFISHDEHIHVLRGLKKHDDGWWRLPDWPEFIEYDLESFTPEERKKFVSQYLKYRSDNAEDDFAWIDQRSNEVNNLADADPDIFAKPVHAKILTDLASDKTVNLQKFSSGVSRWQLYETFFSSLAEREIDKEARRPISESDRLNFLREIAFWLWHQKNGATSFSSHDLPDNIISQFPMGDAADREAQKREYLTGSFLEKKSGDTYYFGHRSFAEFLVAQRMLIKAPSPIEQPVYSALLRDGVLIFLNEVTNKDGIKEWAKTLHQSKGLLHLEYLDFLVRSFGSLDDLVNEIPPSSPLLPALKSFTDKIHVDSAVKLRLLGAMRHPSNDVFFLLLSLIQIPTPSNGKRHTAQIAIAAALLDRVFKTAKVDPLTDKTAIAPEGSDARRIATLILPALNTKLGDRLLSFKGTLLVKEKSEHLRKLGIELGRQPPFEFTDISQDIEVPWNEILDQMNPRYAEKATAYFRKNTTLRNIFTRETMAQKNLK